METSRDAAQCGNPWQGAFKGRLMRS